jgi:hypothetical protein
MARYIPYLDAPDTVLYGIPDATSSQLTAASQAVDAYLGRPEGLLWSPDGHGAPAFMTNLTPARSFTLPSAISAGATVQVVLPYGQFGNQTLGEVVVLDRNSSSYAEACLVTAVSGTTITLANVQFDHAQGVSMDFGLTLLDEAPLRTGSGSIRAARSPIARILGGFSRARPGQLPRQITDSGFGFLSVATQSWTQLDITTWDINQATGQVMVQPYPVQAGALDIRMRYVAGWSRASIPHAIKQAVSNIARAALETPFSGNLKVIEAGDSKLERFSPTMIDSETRALLQPFRLVRV